VLHDGMPYDPIQGQGHEGPNGVRKADFSLSPLPLCM